RYCDIKVRIPRDFAALEAKLLSVVRDRLKRGHIELSARWEELPPGRSEVRVDLGLARSYLGAYERLARELGVPGEVDLSLLAKHEIVAPQEAAGEPEELWP